MRYHNFYKTCLGLYIVGNFNYRLSQLLSDHRLSLPNSNAKIASDGPADDGSLAPYASGTACCTFTQGWKPGYLALGCQLQFPCVETQISGFSFGLVSRLLKNRFQFRFQFCIRATSVSGFQFRFKFHPKNLFYCEYGLFKSSTSWHFCFITMVSSSSDNRVRKQLLQKLSTWV